MIAHFGNKNRCWNWVTDRIGRFYHSELCVSKSGDEKSVTFVELCVPVGGIKKIMIRDCGPLCDILSYSNSNQMSQFMLYPATRAVSYNSELKPETMSFSPWTRHQKSMHSIYKLFNCICGCPG